MLAVDGFTGTMQSGAKIRVSGSGNYGLQNGNLDLTEILLEHGEGKMEAKVSWNQADGKLVTQGNSTGRVSGDGPGHGGNRGSWLHWPVSVD